MKTKEEGFEPPVPFGTSVFKSEAKLNLSTNFNNQQQDFPMKTDLLVTVFFRELLLTIEA